MAFAHGTLVAVALVVLIVYNVQHSGFIVPIVLFVAAALGGLTLVALDLTGKSVPRWLALGHGLIAVAGFVFLLVSAA